MYTMCKSHTAFCTLLNLGSCSSSRTFSHKWLDTLLENNITNNRNNASCPRTITLTAVNKQKNYKLSEAATPLQPRRGEALETRLYSSFRAIYFRCPLYESPSKVVYFAVPPSLPLVACQPYPSCSVHSTLTGPSAPPTRGTMASLKEEQL